MIRIAVLRAGLVPLLGLMACGCAARQTVPVDYASAVGRLRSILGVAQGESRKVRRDAFACESLRSALHQMDAYTVSEVVAGARRDSFRVTAEYYICTGGREKIDICVRPKGRQAVRLSVDYSDWAYGSVGFRPVLWWNPGFFRERKVIKDLGHAMIAPDAARAP